MPSPTTWKKHASLLLSRLRSKRAATGGSSLVVQAGFPTSLADLFVKNHKKILPNKKPNTKHSRPVNPNPNPNPIPQPAVAAVLCPDRTVEIDRSTSSRTSRRLGLGLGFLVGGLLAVGKKWVVVGITILSLLLLVLELFGLMEEKKKPPPPRTVVDGAAAGVVDLRGRGLVSPIRAASASRCSDSESDAFSERSEISMEKRDFDGDRSSGSDVFLGRKESLGEESDVSVERREIDDDRGLENPTNKRRRRKLFGKLFRRKCSRKKDEKEEKCPCLDDSGEKEEGIVDEDGDDIDEFLSIEDSDRIADVDSEEAAPVGENVVGTRTRLWRWRKLVFFVVVLFGLLGGKVVAVGLTLAYVLVSGCTGTVWRR